MNIKKVIIICISIIVSISVFSGCANYREVDDHVFVGGMAFSYDKEKNEITATIETMNPVNKGGDISIEKKVIIIKGATLTDIIERTTPSMGERMFLGHMQLLAVDSSIFSNTPLLREITDWLERGRYIKKDINVVYIPSNAGDIFTKVEYDNNVLSTVVIRNAIDNQDFTSIFTSVDFFEFSRRLDSETEALYLPTIILTKNWDEDQLLITNTEIFSKDKPVGTLHSNETKYLLILLKKFEVGKVRVTVNKKAPEVVICHMYNNRVKTDVNLSEDKISVLFSISLDFEINAINTKNFYTKEKEKEKVEEELNKRIKIGLDNVIFKLQKDFEADVLGIGRMIEMHYPEEWKDFEANWPYVYKTIEIKTEVDTTMKRSNMKY